MDCEDKQKAFQDGVAQEQLALAVELQAITTDLSPAYERRAGGAAPEPRRPPARYAFDTPLLTTREGEVLELVARGFSCVEIARLQQVSVHTIRTHLKNIYAKLGVHSKSEAVFEATTSGLLRSDFWKMATRARPSARLDGVFMQMADEHLVAHGG